MNMRKWKEGIREDCLEPKYNLDTFAFYRLSPRVYQELYYKVH